MWKQFFSKLPRKSSTLKSDTIADSGSHPANAASTNGMSTGAQRASCDGSAKAASGAKRLSAAIFPSAVVTGIEPLISFKDVSNTEKPSLFISKLSVCCVVFDFLDQNNGSADKDIKKKALLDLIEYIDSGNGKFTEQMILSGCKMVAVNLFRVFPPNYRSSSSGGGGEGDEEEPMFDPAWPHLQLVYEFLNKFIASPSLDAKIGKKFFEHSFILKLLDLFDSEDPRERDCLKSILHRIYGKFMVHRPFIRKAVSNIFYRFVFETDRHNGVAELLEVFGSVISGFALPLKEEHKIFLWRVLIPLHKPKTVGVYLQQLTYCVTQYIEKEPKLASSVVFGLLRYWPVTNSQKEVMFLSELEEVLEVCHVVEFQKCMVPLFRRVGRCMNSSHFQVAERAFFLLNNDHIMNLVAQNRQSVMPLIVPALEQNIQSHWNQAVLNLTQNVRRLLMDMDKELFSDCQAKFKADEDRRASQEEMRQLAWERLECAAASQPVVAGNTPVLVCRQLTAN